MSEYLRCPFAHYLSYVKKLTPNTTGRPLQFGSDFHELLEFRGNKVQLNKSIKRMREEYYDLPPNIQADLGEDYIEDLKTIFKDYNRIYKDCPLPEVTEQEFSMKVATFKGEPVYFIGIIDGLYKADGKIVVEEHKTFSQKPNMNTLVMNTQKCLYAKAVQKMTGVFPDAVMWDYIKSTPAKEPIWLEKSEKLSLAKNSNVTPFSWLRACKRHGITNELVLRQANKFQGNIQNFFFRVTLDYVPEMVDKIWESFLYTAKEICKNGEKNKAMNVTRDCSWCSFQPICYTLLTGGDIDHILERDYKLKEDREQRQGVIEL